MFSNDKKFQIEGLHGFSFYGMIFSTNIVHVRHVQLAKNMR